MPDRTIELGEGEKRVYDLDDGETFENVLIDQRADGACFTIRARNQSGWTVRNVGWLGTGEAGDGGNRFQMQVSCPSGGEALIENCYMFGKGTDGPGTELGGIYARASHAGHIDIRHTYIEGFGNNAAYMSAPGKDGGDDGTVAFENCYHRDNTVSQYRIGTPGSIVRNCVGVVDDAEGLRGPYPGTGDNQSARGVWGKHCDDVRVEDSAFVTTPDDAQPNAVFHARYIGGGRSHGDEAVLTVADSDVNPDAPNLTGSTSNARVELQNVGENPSLAVINDGGVPTSAEMAANGGREYPSGEQVPDELDTSGVGDGGSGDNGGSESSVLSITNDGSARGTYRVRVDGTIAEEEGVGIGDEIAEIDDGVFEASGFVRGGTDAYRITGTIIEIEVSGPIEMRLDGEVIDPADYDGETDDGGNGNGDTPDDGDGDVVEESFTIKIPVDPSDPETEYADVGITVTMPASLGE